MCIGVYILLVRFSFITNYYLSRNSTKSSILSEHFVTRENNNLFRQCQKRVYRHCLIIIKKIQKQSVTQFCSIYIHVMNNIQSSVPLPLDNHVLKSFRHTFAEFLVVLCG